MARSAKPDTTQSDATAAPEFSPDVLELVSRHLREWVETDGSLAAGTILEIRSLSDHFARLVQGQKQAA